MSVRRVAAVLASLVIVSVASVGAQPKKTPVPAKDPPTTDPAPPPGDGSGSAATPAEPVEEPPKDMNGVDENPDAPKDGNAQVKTVVVPDKSKKSGYPTEEALRPITLPQNMSEVSIGPHAVLGLGDSTYEGADALRARYGITREVQIGLTYVMAGVYHDPKGSTIEPGAIKFAPGKAVGLDFTVLLQNWVALKAGVPIYIDPVAVGINFGVPMKFQLGDKLAIGGLDDLLSIRVKNFAPSFFNEGFNARQAFEINSKTGTGTSRGALRFSFYGIYQSDPKLAVIAKFGLVTEDFSGTSTNNRGFGGTTTQLRGGIQYSVKRYFDLGISLGWEDLATLSSIGPAGFLAVRI